MPLGGSRRRGRLAVAPLDFSERVDTSAFYKNLLRPALEAVGLPASRPATKDAPAVRGVRLRDLRHAFATLQPSSGAHSYAGVEVAGHSPFTPMLDVYGDYINEDVSHPAGLARPVAAQSNKGVSGRKHR